MNTFRSIPLSEALCQAAMEACRRAYAPYSHFHVGAAILTEDDRIFVGANYESASYGLTLCAERAALVAAQQAGAVESIKAMALTAIRRDPERGWVSLKDPVTPCGACRQWIFEAAHRIGPVADFVVCCGNSDFSVLHETSARELLPRGFAL